MSNLQPPDLLRVKTAPGVQFVMPASVPQSIEVRIARPVTINLVDVVVLFTVGCMELETGMTRQEEVLIGGGERHAHRAVLRRRVAVSAEDTITPTFHTRSLSMESCRRASHSSRQRRSRS